MKVYIYFTIIYKHIATIVIIVSIFERFADAKGRARLSYGVVEAVCKSTAAFLRSSQIQSPSKSPTVNNEPCKTLTWSNCGTRGKATCQKFKLKDCPAQSRSQLKKNKERKIPRIVNGVDAKPHEFPHIVRITRNDDFFCAGTIFNENYIVTAAHCVFFYSGKGANNPLKVIAGDHNTKIDEGTEQIRTVANVTLHEKYDRPKNADNDIAVLLLNDPLEFSENVFPPDMPEPDYDAQGELVTVPGWGLLTPTGNKSDIPDILQKVDLIVDTSCRSPFENDLVFICANSDGEGQSPCKGDSGGPLTKKLDNGCHLFLGVVSHGIGCSSPSVYTKVSWYIGWLYSNTKKS